jgi:hypothetical protein
MSPWDGRTGRWTAGLMANGKTIKISPPTFSESGEINIVMCCIICAQRGEAARSALKATRVCVDQSVTLKNLYAMTWTNVPTKNGGQLSVRPPAHGRKKFAGFWLVEKSIFPNILPIMGSEQQQTVGTHIRKLSELSRLESWQKHRSNEN